MNTIARARSFRWLWLAAAAVLLVGLAGPRTASAQTTLCVKNGKIVSINQGITSCTDKQTAVVIPSGGTNVTLFTGGSNIGGAAQLLSTAIGAGDIGDCMGIYGAVPFIPDGTSTECLSTEFELPSGTLENLDVTLNSGPPGTSSSYTFNVFVSGSATSLACTISGSIQECSDTTDKATVGVGDTLSVVATPSKSPAPRAQSVLWSVQFLP